MAFQLKFFLIFFLLFHAVLILEMCLLRQKVSPKREFYYVYDVTLDELIHSLSDLIQHPQMNFNFSAEKFSLFCVCFSCICFLWIIPFSFLVVDFLWHFLLLYFFFFYFYYSFFLLRFHFNCFCFLSARLFLHFIQLSLTHSHFIPSVHVRMCLWQFNSTSFLESEATKVCFLLSFYQSPSRSCPFRMSQMIMTMTRGEWAIWEEMANI